MHAYAHTHTHAQHTCTLRINEAHNLHPAPFQVELKLLLNVSASLRPCVEHKQVSLGLSHCLVQQRRQCLPPLPLAVRLLRFRLLTAPTWPLLSPRPPGWGQTCQQIFLCQQQLCQEETYRLQPLWKKLAPAAQTLLIRYRCTVRLRASCSSGGGQEGFPGRQRQRVDCGGCLGRWSLFILRLHLGSCKVRLAWRRGSGEQQ